MRNDTDILADTARKCNAENRLFDKNGKKIRTRAGQTE
jgi:hypothetical protein